MKQDTPPPPCRVCMTIRKFLYVSVPLLLIMASQPEITSVRDYDLGAIAGYLAVLVLLGLILYKGYVEFFRGRDGE